MNALIERNIMPKIVRSDRGNENSLLSGIQPYLRHNHNDSLAGDKSFMYGRSTANQRIEAFWGQLRKSSIQFWMNFFKDMIDEGIYDNSNDIHIDCIRYCFMDLIQNVLGKTCFEWNHHRIRKQNNEVNTGMPELLYTIPERFDAENCGLVIDRDEIEICKNLYCDEFLNHQNPVFIELIENLLPNVTQPKNAEEAKALFINMTNILIQNLNN